MQYIASEQLSRQICIQKSFKMKRIAKRIMPECRHTTKNFSKQGRFRGTRALPKTYCQKHKKGSTTKHFGLFFLDTIEATF